MSVHFNSLPDDCILPILDLIPLSDLLCLDQVCHRWASLLPSACARRRTLALNFSDSQMDLFYGFAIPFNATSKVSFDGDRYSRPYFGLPAAERHCTVPLLMFGFRDRVGGVGRRQEYFTVRARLHQALLTHRRLVTYFIELFPNVTTLVLINCHADEADLRILNGLTGLWSLTKLRLWIRTCVEDNKKYQRRPHQHPVRTLLSTIARQSSLRHLTLDLDASNNESYTFPTEVYSFIALLEVVQLSLGSFDQRNLTWDIVHQFDRPTLRQISLPNYSLIVTENGLSPKFKFTPKVSQLYAGHGYAEYETVGQIDELCGRFSALTVLRIKLTSHITFTLLVTKLATLTQLICLELVINFDSELPRNVFALVDRVGGGGKRRTVALPQVKVLEFVVDNARTHLEFESLSPNVFPSVETIIFREGPRSCSICRSPNDIWDPDTIRCFQLIVISLKRKFRNSLVQLYATHNSASHDFCGEIFFDWTGYIHNEDDHDTPEW